MYLRICPMTPEARAFYENHQHYHEGDAGLDLFATEDQTWSYGDLKILHAGVKCAAYASKEAYLRGEKSIAWLLMSRSSIGKTPLRQANCVGLIDGGYRGELMMALDHVKPQWEGPSGSSEFTVKVGDRLCQAVSFTGCPITFEVVDQLDQTARGEGGFGSTGLADVEVTVVKRPSETDMEIDPKRQQTEVNTVPAVSGDKENDAIVA